VPRPERTGPGGESEGNANLGWLAQPQLFNARLATTEEVPKEYSHWVHLQTSMTEAIANQFVALPEVVVHYSGRCTLLDWEARLLSDATATRKSATARHISLLADGEPVMVARSVVLAASAIEEVLTSLQSTPLGTMLFEDGRWQRISQPLPLIARSTLIGRACTWRHLPTSETLAVEEFFLPALLPHR